MRVRAKPVLDYAEFDSPEHKSWKRHRDAMHLVDHDTAQCRFCIGIGMTVDAATMDSWISVRSTVLVPDNAVRWVTIVDVPGWTYRNCRHRRGRHLATARRTTMVHGVPTLTRGAEPSPIWDFRQFPFDVGDAKKDRSRVKLRRNETTLSPTEHPQLFRVFNALSWAMTSTAFGNLPAWMPDRDMFYKLIEVEPKTDSRGVFLYGAEPWDFIPHPDEWMPQAYIAFREPEASNLFEVSTQYEAGGNRRYPLALRNAFADSLGDGLSYHAKFDGEVREVLREEYFGVPSHKVVLLGNSGERDIVRFTQSARMHIPTRRFKEGERIADDPIMEGNLDPVKWRTINADARWNSVEKQLGDKLSSIMRMWFERSGLRVSSGLVHFPAPLVGAASRGGVDSGLMWDVGRSKDYFQNDCDSFVFPGILIEHWDAFSGVLPGDVPFDFTPPEHRVRLSH